MGEVEELLATVEAIYRAGLDGALWPAALARMSNLVGGAAATLEVFKKAGLRSTEFYAHGLPPAAEIKYLDYFVPRNPRLPRVVDDRFLAMSFDYRMFDEETIRHDPFYIEFLGGLGLRYWVGGMIMTNPDEFAGICVHRTPEQGHIDAEGLALMERLVPHVAGAFDMTRRLRGAGVNHDVVERALDWLSDGVALIGGRGAVQYANASFQAMLRRNDVLRLRNGVIEFIAAEARERYGAAVAAAQRISAGVVQGAVVDFVVARPDGSPGYLVSVRPIPNRFGENLESEADAIVFVRDSSGYSAGALRLLRDAFGLTEAEASLARALQQGMTPGDYALARAVSVNTVYTHLRRIKEKTGCHRMPELIRRLNDLQGSVEAG